MHNAPQVSLSSNFCPKQYSSNEIVININKINNENRTILFGIVYVPMIKPFSWYKPT